VPTTETQQNRTVADVRATVKQLLATRLYVGVEALDETATLEELGLDSLLLTEVVAALESRCNARIDVVALAEQLAPTLPLSALLDELAASAPCTC